MGSSGKTATSTQQTTIPPEVLARYNSVNARAEEVAQTPFQQYSQDPNAFVAPINATQQQGINTITGAANSYQPYYAGATGLTLAGTGSVDPGALNTGQYMSPYTQAVADATYANLRQQQQQEQQGLTSNAIQSGAFGGDRAGIAAANLARQQELATAGAMAPIYQQGYSQALQTAQQQQGVNLAAEQANLARLMQGGQQLAGLGSGLQAAGIQGGQAQLAAGTAQQQTEQAGLQAIYNQFLQERGYPFQVAQFLANIAMGTGALSGSTTTTTQPAPLFSDRRLKENVRRIGESDDGQPIYKFRYKGDSSERTHIGFMADEVEKKHPEAVGMAGGFKTVDYDKATPRSTGGVVPPREAFVGGGPINPYGTDQIDPLAGVLQDQSAQPIRTLPKPGEPPKPPESPIKQGLSMASQGVGLYNLGSSAASGIGSMGSALSGLGSAAAPAAALETGLSAAPVAAEGISAAAAAAPAAAEGISAALAFLPLLFSDRRLKENVRRIGESDDGQPIYKFRYKGDSSERTHIGFMADEVEKKHPEAVGMAGGFKTVDYDKATPRSTGGVVPPREAFVGGGLVNDPNFLKTILGWRDPGAYTSAQGPRGTTGTPGGSGYVPQANLPVTNRLSGPSGMPAPRPSGLQEAISTGSQIASLAQMGKGLYGGAKGLYDSWKDSGADAKAVQAALDVGESAPAINPITDYLGGFAFGGRAGFAPGGDVGAAPDDYGTLIDNESVKRGIPPALLRALVQQESGGRPDVIGGAGEVGLGQIKPSTARTPGYGVVPIDPKDLTRPEVNIPFVADYLTKKAAHMGFRDLTDPEQQRQALMLYNAGPNREDYARQVFARMGGEGGVVPAAAGNAAPAAARSVVPASAQPEDRGLSRRPGVLSETAENAPFRTLAAGLLPSMEPDTKKALTSENFWIPMLAGVGSMLASRSPYLGNTIGEGLVGGTSAYTKLQQQQAGIEKAKSDIGLTQAQERGTNVGAAKSSLVNGPNGLPAYVIVTGKDGRQVMLNFGEAYRARHTLDLTPAIRQEIEAAAKNHPELLAAGDTGATPEKAPVAGAIAPPPTPEKAPVAGATAPPAVAPTPAVGAVAETGIVPLPKIFDVSPDEQKTIAAKVNSLQGTDTRGIKDLFEVKRQESTDALEQRPIVMQFANAFAGLPEKGPGATGAAAPALRTLSGWVNSILKMGGIEGGGNPTDLARAEKIEKIAAAMKAAATDTVGQRSFSAFNDIGKMYPTIGTSREGVAANLADIIVRNQMKIDENMYAQRWKDVAAEVNPSLAIATGPQVSQAFMDKFGSQFEKERKSLSKMIMTTIPNRKDPDTNRPYNWFQYVSEHAENLNDKEKALIEKHFGKGVLRYFPGVQR